MTWISVGATAAKVVIPMVASKIGKKAKGGGEQSGGGGGGNAGALMGLLKGGQQAIGARRDQKAADSLQPSLYDPQRQAFLAEINQKRKSILSGSNYAAGMGAIDSGTQGANQAIVQASGGDAAGTIQALLSAQTNANRAKNQVLTQSGQDTAKYDVFAGEMTKSISDRAMQLQLAEQAQKRAVWAQKSQDAFANTTNAVARMGGAGGGEGGSGPSGINWGDVLARHGAARADLNGPDGNPEYNGTAQYPIDSTLGSDSGLGDTPDIDISGLPIPE